MFCPKCGGEHENGFDTCADCHIPLVPEPPLPPPEPEDPGQAHCPHCLAPISPDQDYCETCDRRVGQLTGYIPFVNIPFTARFYGDMWNTLWFDKRAGFIRKAACAITLFLSTPILLLAIPFALWTKDSPSRDKTASGKP